ncbi:hypothetical protein PIROE2DRAFT_61626 [Piromyces sp. E2]|nr:hypothetical protein PIROE2DRAFT_61626 [Piromyces sp. E2]|eukprot:OUM62840.1 hypothetical protein PIROE2DRAFT_61626 [Piromyces sp. E2]
MTESNILKNIHQKLTKAFKVIEYDLQYPKDNNIEIVKEALKEPYIFFIENSKLATNFNTSRYFNEIAQNELTITKKEFVTSYYQHFLEFIIEHVCVNWYPCFSQEEKKELFENYFIPDKSVNEYEQLIHKSFYVMCHHISLKKHNYILQVMTKFLNKFLKYNSVYNFLSVKKEFEDSVWTQYVQLVSFLPDKMVSVYKLDLDNYFMENNFFKKIGLEISQAINLLSNQKNPPEQCLNMAELEKLFDYILKQFQQFHDDAISLISVLENFINTWLDSYFMNNASKLQHQNITYGILICLSYLKQEDFSQTDIEIKFLKGVGKYLESTKYDIRIYGMIIAECMSEKLHKTDKKLDFELEETDEITFLRSLFKNNLNTFANEHSELVNNDSGDIINEEEEDDDNNTIDNNDFDQNDFSEDENPDEVVSELDITYDNSSDEESDDDDLEPYYMEEEEEITSAEELKNKIKPPLYIRDCIDGLIAEEEPNKIEESEEDKNTIEIDNIIDQFSKLNQNQSGNENNENTIKKEDISPIKIIADRIEQHTRRFSRKSLIKKKVTKENKFCNYAKYFFFPLIGKFDCTSEIFTSLNKSEQSLLLERLILTLGIITYCAMNSLDSRRMCRELWNFCWSYRFYETKSQRCNVRNSILFSYSVIFNVLSEDLIVDEFGGNSFFGLGELEELYEWIMKLLEDNKIDAKDLKFSTDILYHLKNITEKKEQQLFNYE